MDRVASDPGKRVEDPFSSVDETVEAGDINFNKFKEAGHYIIRKEKDGVSQQLSQANESSHP